jgi:hypothetical protein
LMAWGSVHVSALFTEAHRPTERSPASTLISIGLNVKAWTADRIELWLLFMA